MKRLTIIAVSLAACAAPADEAASPGESEAPRRIVSLDYCADQYVLALAGREDILALSPYAEEDYSYLREEASGLAKVRPVAEDVLALKPDLIVRSYGGGPQAAESFEKAGIPVVQIGYAATLADVPAVLEQASADLQAEEKGAEISRDYRARLNAIVPQAKPRTVLYMTSGGVTTGPGTMIDEMFAAAGLVNFETRPGWHALPLERLAQEQPDLVASAFYETGTGYMDAWSASGHPVARRQLRERPVVRLDSAWTACGGWFLIEAIEALAEAPDGGAPSGDDA
ncbi:ABC transporter substrate-binding protein [Aquisalinus flavus]|nr:ABC transporter substrate-binding protein [Aquisalinus flavus]UNE49298.1 ABC transporter substrate-binding protein [Aquisalinus flavus]